MFVYKDIHGKRFQIKLLLWISKFKHVSVSIEMNLLSIFQLCTLLD